MADKNAHESPELKRLEEYLDSLQLTGSAEEALEDYLLRRTASELLAAATLNREPGKPRRNTGSGSAA